MSFSVGKNSRILLLQSKHVIKHNLASPTALLLLAPSHGGGHWDPALSSSQPSLHPRPLPAPAVNLSGTRALTATVIQTPNSTSNSISASQTAEQNPRDAQPRALENICPYGPSSGCAAGPTPPGAVSSGGKGAFARERERAAAQKGLAG